MTFLREGDSWSRALCFLAGIPSGGALRAKISDLASMQTVTLALVLPGARFLVAACWWATRNGQTTLADALAIGFWGGLLGTTEFIEDLV